MPAAAGTSIGALAGCSEGNAERAVHKLAQDFQLTLPVQLHTLTGELDEELPVMPMSAWGKFLVQKHLWFSLSGLDRPDPERSEVQWGLFWSRFRAIRPNHEVFQKPEADLWRTAAILLHGDEGRSRKKSAVMILSAHSALGRGSNVEGQKCNEYAQQLLNISGHTWATRWLLSVLPRKAYDGERTANFQRVLEFLVDDFRELFYNGVKAPDGTTFYFAVVHVIGDWPFLVKAFTFERSFQNAAKFASANSARRGICHACLADREGIPFEDFHSAEPRWRSTVNAELPFKTLPAICRLPHDASNMMALAGQDLFHGWHLGAGRTFLASALALLSSEFPGRSVEVRFEAMAADFFSWCSDNRIHPYIRKLTRDTIGWKQSTDYPSGLWSKGNTTLVIMRWFLAAVRSRANNIEEGSLLRMCFKAALNMHMCLSKLYRQQLWIDFEVAKEIAAHGFTFLRVHAECADRCYREGTALFMFMSNLHRLAHIFHDLQDQARIAGHALSPLLYGCQMDEDFIGRPSRITRRTSPKTVMLRTMQRGLEAAHAQYVKAGLLILNS